MTTKNIHFYWHCKQCIAELQANPDLDQSPEEYARLSIGETRAGFQVWCVRHDRNVAEYYFSRNGAA